MNEIFTIFIPTIWGVVFCLFSDFSIYCNNFIFPFVYIFILTILDSNRVNQTRDLLFVGISSKWVATRWKCIVTQIQTTYWLLNELQNLKSYYVSVTWPILHFKLIGIIFLLLQFPGYHFFLFKMIVGKRIVLFIWNVKLFIYELYNNTFMCKSFCFQSQSFISYNL